MKSTYGKSRQSPDMHRAMCSLSFRRTRKEIRCARCTIIMASIGPMIYHLLGALHLFDVTRLGPLFKRGGLGGEGSPSWPATVRPGPNVHSCASRPRVAYCLLVAIRCELLFSTCTRKDRSAKAAE